MSDLTKELFLTKALEMSDSNKAFWYTSGTFGPFYINTQYLYGSATEADELLEDIENELNSMPSFYDKILQKIRAQIERNAIYRKTINLAVEKIKEEFDLSQIEIISGGERRDFFFSIPLADIFQKAHLSVRKDGSTYLHSVQETSDWGGTVMKDSEHVCVSQANLKNKRILHVADIITLASSWIDRWLPAVEKCGGKIEFAFAVLDRCQGGLDRLAKAGIKSCVLERTNNDFFAAALDEGILDSAQVAQAITFLQSPSDYESEFLQSHPEFLEREIGTGGRNAERALLYSQRLEQSADRS